MNAKIIGTLGLLLMPHVAIVHVAGNPQPQRLPRPAESSAHRKPLSVNPINADKEWSAVLSRTVPVRTPEDKEEARNCVGFGQESSRIYFFHNRKAGGTAIRSFLGEQQICRHRFTAFVEVSTGF